MTINKRYSQLQPFEVEFEEAIAIQACNFFHPLNYADMCRKIGREPGVSPVAFEVHDFLVYFGKIFAIESPQAYQHKIKLLLDSLDKAGVLICVGTGDFVMAPKKFLFLKEFTTSEKRGNLWLASTLGPRFVRHIYKQFVVQLTGENKEGDVHNGTGIMLDGGHILTCAHVINDVKLYIEQDIQGRTRTIINQSAHPTIDVGYITLAPEEGNPMNPCVFRNPEVSEKMHLFGYPTIPLSRESALIMQSGEIVSESLTLLHGQEVFLYSAIARPGNSGGPIVAETGHILGIVTQENDMESLQAQDPFYAGISTKVIESALMEINAPFNLPIEDYE